MNYLLIHALECHYEMVPSVLHYFRNAKRLDFYMPTDTDTYGHGFNEWNKVFNKLEVPYNFVSKDQVKNIHDYDCFILDTDDNPKNWDFIKNNLSHYSEKLVTKKCKMFSIHHGLGRNMLKKCGFEDSCDTVSMYVPGLNIENIYYWSAPLITTNKKCNVISMLTSVNIVVLGDIMNRDKKFIENLKTRITNHNDVHFHFINRYYSEKLLSDIGTSGLNISRYEDIPTLQMYNILFICDYIYYYPETIITTLSGSYNISYSTLCKYICPIEYIEKYKMGNDTGLYIDGWNGSVVATKITKEDIIRINDEGVKMRNLTEQYLLSKQILCSTN